MRFSRSPHPRDDRAAIRIDELHEAPLLDGPRHTALAVAAGLVLPIAVAALLSEWRDQVSAASAAVILAGVVVLVAATGRRSAAIAAAASATVGFDVFHALPYGSLTFHERDDAITAVALLVVGLVTAGLQTRSNAHRAQFVDASDDIARIAAVTDLLASGREIDEIVSAVAVELTDLLSLRHCHFVRGPADPDATDGARIERTGEVSYGTVRWDAGTHGLPGSRVELPVHALGELVGRFVCVPNPGVPVSYDRRLVAIALTDQVGAAIALQLVV